MRVSPLFNRIAAPLLYHSVTLDDPDLMIVGYYIATTLSRKASTKGELFKLVQDVNLSGHAPPECTYDKKSWTGVEWKVSTLRQSRHICPCARHISPRKIIVQIGRSSPKPIQVQMALSVEKLVLIMEPEGLSLPRHHLRSGLAFQGHRPKRAVLMFWTTNPAAAFERPPTRYPTLRTPAAALIHFLGDVAWLTTNLRFPEDILVVNVKSLWSLTNPFSATTTTANDDCLERFVERLAWVKNSPALANTRELDTVTETRKFRTDQELDKVKVKFIDMETYLAEYDWKGELSDELVAPWFAAMREKEEGNR